MRVEPLGDSAVLVRVAHGIGEGAHARVLRVAAALRAAAIDGVHDVVPAFTTVTAHFDPARCTIAEICARIRTVDVSEVAIRPAAREHVITVRYDGPDLVHVAEHARLTVDDVVRLHTAGVYRVHMIGFVPGFPYLAGLDARLHCPRRDAPRVRVPAGSVAIGGAQTGIYPLETPGGWHLIGQTDAVLFDPLRTEPNLLHAGDIVRFAVA